MDFHIHSGRRSHVLIRARWDLQGGVWSIVERLNGNFGTIGYVIIGVFVVSWVGSVALYRLKGYERFESAEAAD